MALPFLFGKGVARMFRKMVETIIGGAIGLVTLYVVAKVAYGAGHDMAEAEHRREELENHDTDDSAADNLGTPETECPEEENGTVTGPKEKKQSKLGLLLSLRKFAKKGKGSILGDLMKDPENHQLEAYVHEGEVHINIRKRRSLAKTGPGNLNFA